MADLLVRLYDLKDGNSFDEKDGIRIVRAMTPSKHRVIDFVRKNFDDMWASECEAAFRNLPVTCYIAVSGENEIVGFCAYEATAKCYLGPIGVQESYRKFGIGKRLLAAGLKGLKELGYAYGVIGGVNDKVYPFYEKTFGAIRIEGSEPGIYRDLI